MAKAGRYKTRKGYIKYVSRGIKAGKYARPKCSSFTRRYCYTTRGRIVACGRQGKQYHVARHTSHRCRNRHTGKFTYSKMCQKPCGR